MTGTAAQHADTVRALAVELLADLTGAAGDPQAVTDVLEDWHTDLDTPGLLFVALATLRDVFALHLTRVPTTELPPGALVLTERNPDDHPTA